MPRPVTDEDVGLKVLYEPPEGDTSATIDVVAVHGIGAHPDDTWCKDVNEDASSTTRSVNWLKDRELLPSIMKDARIMRYGYHSQWFGRDALQQNASRIAPGLLDALKRKRKGIFDRPLIFIAHSFGGLVLLRTLMIGHLDEKQWPGVFVSTVGIVFFGTPFRGSKALHPTSMIEAALTQHKSYEVQPDMLHGLEPGTEWLKGLVDDYWRVWRLQLRRTKILCLYEQRASPLSSIVGVVPKRIEIAVTEEEGCLDSSTEEITNRALPRSHFNMNKFAKPTEHDFETVCDHLLEMRDEAKSILEARGQGSKVFAKTPEMIKAQKECLRSLYFPEMCSRRNDIADPAVETCAWLSQHKVYLEWLEQKHGLLWIKGKPGAGKSTLMRHAVAMIERQKRQANLVIASFFFHGRGSLIQKSPLGLFKSLLHQILQQIPELLLLFSSLFKKRREIEAQFGTVWDWKERDLQDFFKYDVADSARIRPIILYIDALDECGEQNAIKLVDYFGTITSRSSVLDASLSICFSCRHYPLVSSDLGLQVCVEDETNEDIQSYIQNMMWTHIGDNSLADEARNEIVTKSYGNFQWVVLIVPRVLHMYKRGRDRNMKKIIQAIPSDLGELYRSLLEEVIDDDLPRTLKLFQWICFAQKPLSLEELRIATVIDMNTPYRSIRECQEDEQYADTNEEMARRVVDLSKGLVEVRVHYGNQIAQFNHQSVNDYVLDRGLRILENLPSGSAAGRAHFQLSRSCIRYMNMEEIMTCGIKTFSKSLYKSHYEQNKDLEEKFPFLRYAVQSWVPHAQEVERENITQEDLLKYFHEPSRNLMQNCIVSRDVLDRYGAITLYPGTTLLHVASRFNLQSVVKVLLSLDDIEVNPKDAYGISPLHDAAKNGHEEIVRLLLKRNDIKVNPRDIRGQTPFSRASQRTHETVVRLLLEREDVDADSKDSWDCTPLSYAAKEGDKAEAVMRLLLKREDVNANSKDNIDRTPLSYAAQKGDEAEAVMRLLLEREDVDANSRDYRDRTPLLYAIQKGDEAEAVVRLLLERKDVDVDFKDQWGSTPLSYAVRKGDEAKTVVRLLLKREDVDANSKDNQGRTPLCYAVSKGDDAKTVVRLLLERNDVDANSKSNWGCTPLSYAVVEGDEAMAVVRLLLQREDVDANSKDGRGHTPLWYAANCRRQANNVIRLLESVNSANVA